ncbi:MAG: matrixin family metalloprotease [Gammaproteobacteria bacterium]|nr:matrixin family metalloprotease [Gammaproteobacteria bacterium]
MMPHQAARIALLLTLAGLFETAAVAPAAHAQPSLIVPLDASRPITYSIAEGEPGSEYRAADRELAAWAFDAWRRAAEGALRLEAAAEAEALVRIYFVPASAGQYGEMRPLEIDGRRGAAVYIRPDVRALGPDIARAATDDPLLRDTIVYLTCLHELGHALGLVHTSNYDDIMYFFGYGGDITAFFGRYRERIESRSDIAAVSGLSEGDVAQLGALYGASRSLAHP